MHVIRSKETGLFWSNVAGWCDLGSATRFVGSVADLNLPISGEWLLLSDVEKEVALLAVLLLDVSAVAIELTIKLFAAAGFELESHGKDGKYVYEPFDGFPGFWKFCAQQGSKFHVAQVSAEQDGSVNDDWVADVDKFVSGVKFP